MSQGIEQRVMTSKQQAYMQYTTQIIRQGSALATSSQPAVEKTIMGLLAVRCGEAVGVF